MTNLIKISVLALFVTMFMTAQTVVFAAIDPSVPVSDSTTVEGSIPTGDSTTVEGEESNGSGIPAGDSTAVDGDNTTEDSSVPPGDNTSVEGNTPAEENNNNSSSGGRSSGGGSRSSNSDDEGEVLGAFSSSCGMYLMNYLRIETENNPLEVIKLQLFLVLKGYDLEITGVFDSSTDYAVRLFQSDLSEQILDPWYEGMPPTGYVYKTTRYTINNIICPGSESFPELY